MLVVGELVGTVYRIVRLIGQGGMGEVYEALHEPISRRVAIKTMRPELFGDPELVARFRREAEASAALGHPNIVQVTDFLMEPGQPPIMVMELLEGRTLRSLVSSAEKLETSRGVFIALQILSGLAAAHKAGIVHRDVKPANVFLQKTLAVRDHVKLLDFGVAKLAEGGRADANANANANAGLNVNLSVPVTERGAVMGTRAYMAPEQELGHDVDARADLYSVGATLYYALSGKKHRELNADARSPVPLRRMAPHVNAKLAAVVERALAFEPAQRFVSAEEMAEALAAFSKNASGLGTATFLPGKGLEDAAAAAAAATTAAVALGAARPRFDSATETAPPMTVRDARFERDVIDSDGMIRSEPTATDPLETTVDDPMSRKMMDEGASVSVVSNEVAPTKLSAPLQTERMRSGMRPEPHGPSYPAPAMPVAMPPNQVTGGSSSSGSELTRPATPEDMMPLGGAYPSYSAPPPTKRQKPSRITFVLLIVLFITLLVATLLGGRLLSHS